MVKRISWKWLLTDVGWSSVPLSLHKHRVSKSEVTTSEARWDHNFFKYLCVQNGDKPVICTAIYLAHLCFGLFDPIWKFLLKIFGLHNFIIYFPSRCTERQFITVNVSFSRKNRQLSGSCYGTQQYLLTWPWSSTSIVTRQAMYWTVILRRSRLAVFAVGKQYVLRNLSVSLALVIKHAKRMRRIILSPVACLVLPNFFFHSNS